jgi:hypothetical protein
LILPIISPFASKYCVRLVLMDGCGGYDPTSIH